MKIPPLFSLPLERSLLACSIAIGIFATPLSAQTLYFDQNGTTANFGFDRDVTYTWNTNEANAVWNTNSSGGNGTLSAWNNTGGNRAFFDLVTNDYGGEPYLLPLRVNLTEDITVADFYFRQRGNWSDLIFKSDMTGSETEPGESRTIHFSAPATINVDTPAYNRTLVFSDYINLPTQLRITGTGNYGTVQITGAGDAYKGTITIETLDTIHQGFYINQSSTVTAEFRSRVDPSARFVINSGALLINTLSASAITIAELSGTGGFIRPVLSSTLTLNQATNTTWGGQLGGSAGADFITFNKEGDGRLSLTGTGIHYVKGVLTVKEGELYARGDVITSVTANTDIVVSAGATFGGTSTTNKRLTLSAATSVVTAGMSDSAGTLTLQSGINAANGGTFIFNLGGSDTEGDLLNSSIVVTGGTVTLGGTKTVHLRSLGLEPLIAGTDYVLFDASAPDLDLTAGWDTNWELGSNTTGFEIESFGVMDEQLVVRFSAAAIPESSSLGLTGAAALALWLVGNRRRKRGETASAS